MMKPLQNSTTNFGVNKKQGMYQENTNDKHQKRFVQDNDDMKDAYFSSKGII